MEETNNTNEGESDKKLYQPEKTTEVNSVSGKSGSQDDSISDGAAAGDPKTENIDKEQFHNLNSGSDTAGSKFTGKLQLTGRFNN